MSNTLYTKTKNSSDHDDIWDDSLLIKAYEESVKLQSEEVAKKVAMKTNKQQQQQVPNESESKSSGEIVDKQYKVGDFVRSTYKQDGVDYEAEIMTINENGTALIKYIGYGNEERVKVEELTDSWGEDQRNQQKTDAENDNALPAEENENISSQDDLHNYVINKSQSLRDKMPIPPMPPMPPGMFENSKDAEYMSAMLMSWYMSGYYTGLYQGRKELKDEHQHDNNSSREDANPKQERKRQRKHNEK